MTDKFNLLSDEQLANISSGKLWNFHGGVHPQENKLQSNQSAIRDAGIPATLVIPIQHKTHVPELLVKVGDTVLKGQPLTKVYGALVVQHASSSGVVVAIENRPSLHPSGLDMLSVVIQTDGLDRSVEARRIPAYQDVEPALLIDKIQQLGVIGLGGAGFPTHLKLMPHAEIKLLLINAAECEPYITADDRLIQEQAIEMIDGINVLEHILQPQLTVIAIEDNKKDAISALQKALQNHPKNKNIKITIIPTIYPSGSAKQLIEIITGEQTPIGHHASELGIVMLNVGTAVAVKEAVIDGKALTSRIVTLTGDSLQKKGNVSVRIGTPIQYLLDRFWVNTNALNQIIIGGPMMGFTVENPAAPVTKICNCILAPTAKEMPPAKPEMPCIRCSECAEACPANLLPQQLLWYSKSQDHDKLNDYNLSACIECGACAYVCPSHIPLVEYYRIAKAEIRTAQEEAKKAEIARIRHEKREARLAQAKIDRQAKHKQAAEKRKAQLKEKNGGEDLIAAALARAKAKKANASETQSETEQPVKKNDAVAAAIARAKAKKAAQAGNIGETQQSTETAPATPKNPAVAAAIARAKAKKAAQAGNIDDAQQSTETTPATPKNPAVAAAIARAKAKKAAQAEKATASDPAEETSTVNVDPKKAAIAAAVARAKAKKAAQAEKATASDPAEETSTVNVDPKKAAIAAAVARAKAKKAAQAEKATASDPTEETSTVSTDPKKAAIAAAIARAKAKKAERSEQVEKVTQQAEPDNSAVIAERKKRKQQAQLQKQQAVAEQVTEAELSPAEIKKAKIAAAVARAKAKKVQNSVSQAENEEQK
ncbi:electron transport complex subunit C [Psychromonas marina]|uniref:Ion-translocating oxidoreductase complex subunit C n=1 Tax=Psychromonas marina TaxID=88364 RepID=A0ABQ6E416_9GAMM|nr:electron transport complex subunit RsxC [Psychromonas marina]GLS91989.1 electron transport complex subunit C [Psychromonas marina]